MSCDQPPIESRQLTTVFVRHRKKKTKKGSEKGRLQSLSTVMKGHACCDLTAQENLASLKTYMAENSFHIVC